MDDWLIASARRFPERAALSGGTTYADLEAGAARTARRLAALGVRAGDRVVTTLPAGREFAELLHGLPRLGAVLVPLSSRLTAGERRLQEEDAAPRLAVHEPLEGAEADVDLRELVDPDEPHTLLFTSGSTARPKPVVLTYRNHAASARASAQYLGVDPDDRWLCVLPVYHVGGLAILIRSAIYGTAAIVHDRFDAEAARLSLESGEATLASFVPTMLARLRDAGLECAPALRAALLGGGPVPHDLLDWSRERGIPVRATYGMTEAASQVATAEPWEPAAHPLPGVELRIAGGGEVLVRGEMVAGGGWLHTGDRGRLDEEGRLHVEGRLKDVIVTGGENVSAAEVEQALLAHPGVSDAAVTGRPDAEWGEAVAAFVVSGATPADLGAWCRERLAPFKVPKSFYLVDELPRTAAGKLERWRLLDPVGFTLLAIPRFNEAASGGDPARYLPFLHPAIDTRPVTVAAEGRWLRGHDDVERYLRGIREAFSWLEVRADEVLDLGDDLVLLTGEWKATGRASGVHAARSWAMAQEVRDGLVTWARAFESRDEALAAAERRRRGEPDPE